MSGPALEQYAPRLTSHLDAQREELPFSSSASSPIRSAAAAVVIAGDRLRARAGPFHRPAGPLGRQHDGEKLRIDLVAHAEGAADIDRADAEFLRRRVR